MVARAHLGRGVGISGTGPLKVAQNGATRPPATKPTPASAASGLAENASPKRPLRSASAACVVPHVGHGMPVMPRNGQPGTNGTSKIQKGRSNSEETATAPQSHANWRSSRCGLRQPNVTTYRAKCPTAAAIAAPKAAARMATHTQHSASGSRTASADLPCEVRWTTARPIM